VKKIIMPLKKTSLTIKEIEGCFLNVETLLRHHLHFLPILQDRSRQWTADSTIGDIFLRYTEFIWDYQTYYKNYNRKRIDLLCLRDDFRQLKEDFEQSAESRLPLESFLIAPIQRIPRYLLFLQELCRNTIDPQHMDYQLVRRAYEKIKAMLEKLNSCVSKLRTEANFL